MDLKKFRLRQAIIHLISAHNFTPWPLDGSQKNSPAAGYCMSLFLLIIILHTWSIMLRCTIMSLFTLDEFKMTQAHGLQTLKSFEFLSLKSKVKKKSRKVKNQNFKLISTYGTTTDSGPLNFVSIF